MAGVYSVGQVNTYIKNMFTQDILLNRLSVKGEVSNCKYHASGHIYFTLKDESGTLSAVMFAGNRSGLAFRMTDGQQVVVSGNVGVYERDGKYQMYASQIVPDGTGDLFQRYQQLKNELEEMGMFAKEYKKPIPLYSRKVGIVTAKTGAAVRDIMNISTRRNPYVQLVLYPAVVQGEYAVSSIVKGIKTLDEYGVDVIIAGRGGGSIEDLWAFNEEPVARAIFDCHTPIISAVGHETDYTIADFAADLRAPTPSAAAELAVCDVRALSKQISDYRDRLLYAAEDKISVYRERLREYEVHFKYLNPEAVLREKRQRTLDYEDKVRSLTEAVIERKKHELTIRCERLNGVSPLKRISAGYGYVEDAQGKGIKSIRQVREQDLFQVYLADGVIEGNVVNTSERKLPS